MPTTSRIRGHSSVGALVVLLFGAAIVLGVIAKDALRKRRGGDDGKR